MKIDWLTILISALMGAAFFWTASGEVPDDRLPPPTTAPQIAVVEDVVPDDTTPPPPTTTTWPEVCVAVYPRPAECGPPYDTVPTVTIEPWLMDPPTEPAP